MKRRILDAGLAALLCLAAIAATACGSTPRATGEATGPWVFARTEELPEPGQLDDMTLAQALESRRSVRGFSGTPLTAQQVADLFWAAQGVTSDGGGRTAPSAGALYPLEAYLVTATGIRHYVPAEGSVQIRDDTRVRGAIAEAIDQEAASQAPAVFVITGTASRLQPKYLFRAEEFMLMEAGHAAQNLLLAATALGLGAVPIGAFSASAAARALALPEGERVIYAIPVGHPFPSP